MGAGHRLLARVIGSGSANASVGRAGRRAAVQGRSEEEIAELLARLKEAARQPLGVLADPDHDLGRWAQGTRAMHDGDARTALHHFAPMRLSTLRRLAALDRIQAAVRAGDHGQAAAASSAATTAASGPSTDAARSGVPVGVGVGVEDVGERAVDLASFAARGRLVDRGADQRMPDAEPACRHHDQTGALGVVERCGHPAAPLLPPTPSSSSPSGPQATTPGDQELVTVVVAASDCSRWFRAVFELLLPIWLSPKASPIQATHRTSGTTAGSTIERFEDNIMPAVRITETSTTDHELSTRRLNIMRLGYAFMGVGLAIVKWPILVQNASSLPVFEGVVACLLTAMSLLAFLGLRYPVRMLPILLFECRCTCLIGRGTG